MEKILDTDGDKKNKKGNLGTQLLADVRRVVVIFFLPPLVLAFDF
jgi:hypothetical protein